MDESFNYEEFIFTLLLGGEKRVVSFTWVKVNPACRTVPVIPLDFYIIKTKDDKENWVLL